MECISTDYIMLHVLSYSFENFITSNGTIVSRTAAGF